jgi:Uncharacterized protein conserved in bacteria
MKLILAIVRDTDNEAVSRALTSASFRVTMIASTGGLLRHGRTTLMIGLEDDQVENALGIIRTNCAPPAEAGIKRATIFVVKVDQFVQF